MTGNGMRLSELGWGVGWAVRQGEGKGSRLDALLLVSGSVLTCAGWVRSSCMCAALAFFSLQFGVACVHDRAMLLLAVRRDSSK